MCPASDFTRIEGVSPAHKVGELRSGLERSRLGDRRGSHRSVAPRTKLSRIPEVKLPQLRKVVKARTTALLIQVLSHPMVRPMQISDFYSVDRGTGTSLILRPTEILP